MTRSAEFGATVSQGIRARQPDLVVYRLSSDQIGDPGPRVGLVVSKAVGNAVQRHRVSRQLRHAARAVLGDLDPDDRMVIRALPGSSQAPSCRLEQELRAALERIRRRSEAGQ